MTTRGVWAHSHKDIDKTGTSGWRALCVVAVPDRAARRCAFPMLLTFRQEQIGSGPNLGVALLINAERLVRPCQRDAMSNHPPIGKVLGRVGVLRARAEDQDSDGFPP